MAGTSESLTEALRNETPEVIELRAANRRLQQQLRRAQAKVDELVGVVYTAAKDAALTIGPPPKIPAPKAVKSSKRQHVALLHTTDWQGGKRTADYDLGVLEQRLGLMLDKTLALTETHGNPVREVVVMFGGDDIEGVTIFPTQPFEVHAGLYEQVFAVVRLKRMIVDRLLANYQRVRVVRKWGNHGRIGRFGELPDTDNLDLIADHMAADAYRGNPRVEWCQSLDYVQRVDIGNYAAALLHGNEFHRSFSAERITRKVVAWKANPTWGGFRDVYLGHFHRRDAYGLPDGGMIYLTGSPESSNAYAAEQLAAVSVPSQRLHFIDPDKGRVHSEHILYLDG